MFKKFGGMGLALSAAVLATLLAKELVATSFSINDVAVLFIVSAVAGVGAALNLWPERTG